MKTFLAALLALALALAGQAHAKGLVVTPITYSANGVTGLSKLGEVGLGMLNTLGASYDVMGICDFPEGSTDAMRRGAVYRNGIGASLDSTLYSPIIILGSDMGFYTSTVTASAAAGSGGVAILRTATAQGFQWYRPGLVVTGTPITGSAVIVSVDSTGAGAYQRMTVKGTVAYSASFTLTFRTPLRPDSLTRTVCYPRVPILHIGQYMNSTTTLGTVANRCSTGVGTSITYAAAQDSTLNVYEVGTPSRTWKAHLGVAALSTRDTRGWRPIVGVVSTRQGNAGLSDGNFDFPDATLGAWAAYSTNPDTVALWMVMNRDAAGVKIGGDAAPVIYAIPAHINGTNSIDPGIMLTAFALADSCSGGGLFGSSAKLPRQMSFHIDDGWKRGDSRYASSYGGIGVTDTVAFKASIDSLAALQIPFVVGVECDSLGSVLLAADGTTGDGRYYDQRWWARAPLAHYTPHCHAGLVSGTNRTQNNATKFLRPLDLWGLTRTRYSFGSVDSLLAYGQTDYVNDVADSAATYWLSARAKAMCDSVFGSQRVDGLVMPPGDDWTNFQVKHTSRRQHGLGVDSIMAAAVMSGMKGIRMNARGNVVGNDDSTVTNNYGWWVTSRRMTLANAAGGPGLPSWAPAKVYGRPCQMLTTDGYPGAAGQGSSVWSWSRQRSTYSGEKFLLGLLAGHVDTATDPTTYGREVYVLASHCSDFGSSGRYTNNEATRPMFYTFKYVTNAIRTANAHARQDLVRFVYPDQVSP